MMNEKTRRDTALTEYRKWLRDGTLTEVPNPCLCGNAGGEVLAEADRYGLPVRTVFCEKCGLVRTDPYLDDKSLTLFYERLYRDIYTETEPVRFYGLQKKFGETLLNYCRHHGVAKPGDRVMDVGCCTGGALEAFKAVGCTVQGCDYNESYMAVGRDKGLDLRHGSIDQFEEKAFDLVIMNHVFEHFAHPLQQLERLKRVIKPGGHLFIAVPGVFSIIETYGSPDFYVQNAHVFHYTKQTLARTVARAGFSLVTADERVYGLFVNDGKGMGVDALFDPLSVRRYWALAKDLYDRGISRTAFKPYNFLFRKAWELRMKVKGTNF